MEYPFLLFPTFRRRSPIKYATFNCIIFNIYRNSLVVEYRILFINSQSCVSPFTHTPFLWTPDLSTPHLIYSQNVRLYAWTRQGEVWFFFFVKGDKLKRALKQYEFRSKIFHMTPFVRLYLHPYIYIESVFKEDCPLINKDY